MNLRTRLILSSFLLVFVPLATLGYFLERSETERTNRERTERADLRFATFEANWDREQSELEAKLAALEENVRSDRPLRAAILSGTLHDPVLLDAASRYMRLAGFDVLYLLDESSTILSSGHFRNEFGTHAGAFRGASGVTFRGGAATEIAFADRSTRTWMLARPFRFADRELVLAAGITLDPAFLARLRPDPDTRVVLRASGARNTGREARDNQAYAATIDMHATTNLTRAFPVASVTPKTGPGDANDLAFVVTWDASDYEEARAAARRNRLLTLGATGAGMLLLSFWFAARLSSPLLTLSSHAAEFDLDRPTVTFEMERKDEVGRLATLLEEMKTRIVRNTGEVRAAERRAAIGDLARQVNHDLKNGLAPLRNIFRHLASLPADDPAALGRIWTERRASAEQSVAYLEELATNYERLRPDRDWRNCSLNDTIRSVLAGVPDCAVPARGTGGGTLVVRTELDDTLPLIRASATDLRRIVENLIRNGWESMQDTGGTLTIKTMLDEDGAAVLFRVRDEGPGMDDQTAARVFEDFFTTKETGSGLGLTIVRRLVTDHGGKIEFDSRESAGTEFRVLFPVAEEAASDSLPGDSRA